jgi:hypothetical protein
MFFRYLGESIFKGGGSTAPELDLEYGKKLRAERSGVGCGGKEK